MGPVTIRSTCAGCQVNHGGHVIEIIALVAELAPKVIGARKYVVDLWQSAAGIIADAEKTGALQKFVAVHGSIHNHFNLERHLISRRIYKHDLSAAMTAWQLHLA